MANTAQTLVKISGYLEKKAKLRIGSPWKKYWFVLEGRLLLYYRSKDEYEALSPCKGSVNLCPPCNVKPALSAVGVFQIECRANTITLRAENRAEQERWMQALLAVIAQSKSSPNRMSHFRYSLDDLPVPVTENKKTKNVLLRQNSMPYRISSASPDAQPQPNDIINRLQNLGAQKYCGSLETITKFIANKEHHEDIDLHQDRNHTNHNKYQFAENGQYSIIQEENSIDLLLSHQHANPELRPDGKKTPRDQTEKVKSLLVDNEQYISSSRKSDDFTETLGVSAELSNESASEDSSIRTHKEIQRIEHLYERISTESSLSTGHSTNLYERISDSSLKIKLDEQYSIVKKSSKESLKSQEYSLPVNSKTGRDSLIINNDQYVPSSIDDIHSRSSSNVEAIEYDEIDQSVEMEGLYEEPDRFKIVDVEPMLPPRHELKKHESSEETSSQTSSQDGNGKRKKRTFKIFRHLGKSEEKKKQEEGAAKGKPKSHSTSFIRKVWKKKTKSLESCGNDVLYEPVDYRQIEKQISKNKNDIEMLQELQNILESRKNMLQEKLKLNEGKLQSEEKPAIADEGGNAEEPDEERPELPPRQSLQSSTDQTSPALPTEQHFFPIEASSLEQVSSGQNIPLSYQKALNDEAPAVKTIDEILEDLDKEKSQKKKKVRQLIEKFEDAQNDDEVVLRKKITKSQSDTLVPKCFSKNITDGDSDELSKLLEELSKVTSAPVLTPGVTSSLVTPVLTDDEWLQLIPIRRRRLSDPDYDVPRPHRSLQLQNRPKEAPAENIIPATRFFGPILPPDLPNNTTSPDTVSWTSMDPDSLEIGSLPTKYPDASRPTVPLHLEKARNILTYASHSCGIGDDRIIYSLPKTMVINTKVYESKREVFIKEKQIGRNIEVSVKNIDIGDDFTSIIGKTEEMFIDSLEPLAEISTAF